MKKLILFLSLFSSTFALADEVNLSEPPARPARLEPVEGECEVAFSLVLNRPVPAFFLHEDGTLNCHAIAIPRSQAGYAILMADWAENLNEWYRLEMEIKNAEIESLRSSHQLEISKTRKNARTEGAIIGAGSVMIIFLTAFAISL